MAGEYVRDGPRRRRAARTGASTAPRGRSIAATAGRAGDLSRAATAATDYVAENPGKALLLAASAGFVLGMLVRRRRLSA